MQQTLSVINLTNIRKNVEYLKSLIGGAKFYAVVKADAYGHGAERVCSAIEDMVDGFCVAIVDEGAFLRVSGITKPILVFAPILDADDALRAKHYNLTVTVNGASAAKLIGDLPCHIKVNTGMNRYGCPVEEIGDILSLLKPEQVLGVYSHLYSAENAEARQRQLKLFNTAERAVKAYNKNAISHISASGGTLLGGEFIKDCVRCGIAIYGYSPEGFENGELIPALKVYAYRAQTTQFCGGGVGYGEAKKSYNTLTTYRCGYADGFMRAMPLGENNLCMDAYISQENGDIACVLNNAKAYAKKCNTISYEVLCSVTRRSKKVYER